MKIDIKNLENRIHRANEIKYGECFVWEGCIYMVLNQNSRSDYPLKKCRGIQVVAVNLGSGVADYFPIETIVVPLNLKVVRNDPGSLL